VPLFLDLELLERFDAELRALGSPIVDTWAPGLSDDQIDALLQPLGIDLPEEARVWWRWHNGARLDAAPITRNLLGGGDPLPLELEAEVYASEHGAMKQVWEVEKLLGPIGGKPKIYFCCAGPREQPVPIYTQDDIEAPAEVLPSIGELVLAWIELIQEGVWTPRADGGLDIHWGKVPADVRRMGIVTF
jgi:hypothetical protein